MAEGGFSSLSHLPDTFEAANIEFQRNSAAAERLYFGFEFRQAIAFAAGKN